MKAVFTKLFSLFLVLFMVGQLSAQINGESPYPVEVEVLTPPTIAGTYDYGTQTTDGTVPIWGPELSETVAGELQWGYTAAGDSLACEPVVTDLTGKMALIRRGICNFSLKVYHAQEAGAIGAVICNHYDDADNGPNTIVNMLGGDSLEAVTIPAIFLSRASCEAITMELDAGNTVEISFSVRTMQEPIAALSYFTPESQIIPMNAISVNLINTSGALADVTVIATVIDPSGNVDDLLPADGTVVGLEAFQDSTVFFESYTPTEQGEYTVLFTNDISEDTLTTTFAISETTWAADDNDVLVGIGPSQDLFVESGLVYQAANLYLPNDQGTVVTHASFGVENVDELFTGDPSSDVFAIIVYDADANDDGTLDIQTSFDDLTPVASGEYVLTGDEEPNQLLVVELESFTGAPVTLDPDGAYYVSILYNGINAGLGVAPLLTSSPKVETYAFYQALFLDQFYNGGWAGWTNMVRLHVEGFDPATYDPVLGGTVSVDELLADYKVTLAPNPASEFLRVTFNLDEAAGEVLMNIYNFDGKIIRSERLEGVVNDTYSFDVRNLPAGTYFLSILTPEGFRSKKFVVAK